MTDRRVRMWRTLLGVLAALALAATSCGGGASDAVVETAASDASDAIASDAPAAATSAPAATEPAASAADSSVADSSVADSSDVAPQASLIASTVGGGQIDFGSLEGQDVVLWFWAPW